MEYRTVALIIPQGCYDRERIGSHAYLTELAHDYMSRYQDRFEMWTVGRSDGSPMLPLKDGKSADAALAGDIALYRKGDGPREQARYWDLAVEGAEPGRRDRKRFDLSPAALESDKMYFLIAYGNKGDFLHSLLSFETHAFIREGRWYMPRTQTWNSNSPRHMMEEKRYRRLFRETMESLSPETLVIGINCRLQQRHIKAV